MRRVAALAITLLVLAGCTAAPGGQPARPTSPAARSDPPFYGLDVPHADTATAERFDHAMGFKASVLSVFIRLDTTTTRQKMNSIVAAGYTPFVTLEPWRSGFASGSPDPADALRYLVAGRFDAEITRQARALASIPGPFYLRFAHEMNADWYPWGNRASTNTPAEYIAAWKRVHDLVDDVLGHRARWVWSPVRIGQAGASGELARFYPGDNEVDFLGLTAYEHVSPDPGDTFGPSLSALAEVSHKPVLLAEIGSDGPHRDSWLSSLGAYVAEHPIIRGLVYFDTSRATTGATGDYELDTSATRTAFGHSLQRIGAART